MTVTTHPVAPEEIMAWLDGELNMSEAQAVSAHLATCPDCGELANQFRSTSLWLSRWEIEPVPARLEAAIEGSAALPSNAYKPARTWLQGWRLWTGSVAVGLAAATIAIAFIFPNAPARSNFKREELAHQTLSNQLVAPREGKADRYSGGGLEQLGKGPEFEDNESKQLDSLDRMAKLMSPPVIKRPATTQQAMSPKLPPTDKFKGATPTAAAPMIARTVSITILVKDVADARAVLDTIVAHHHGYAAELNLRTPEGGPRGFDSSLRIPAPELMQALGELRSLGRVEGETQSADEVSQQHADLVARLHNARESEDRLRSILEQRTGKLADVLEVEEEISRVRGEIESMEAEQQTLEHRVDFATVDVQLTEEYKAQLNSPADSVSTRLHNALISGYKSASDTIIGIILFVIEYGPAILIWLLILTLPIFFLWRRYRSAKAGF